MALPILLKYIYNKGTDEIIRSGKKIHTLHYAELAEHNELSSNAVFRVRDDIEATWYKVHIQQYKNEKSLNVYCSCAYENGDICNHEVGSLFQLQELFDKNLLNNVGTNYNQKHTLIKMKHIDLKTIKMLCSTTAYEDAETFLKSNKAIIEKAEEERVVANLTINSEIFNLVIRKNEERNFDTSCTCTATQNPLCEHKTILFLQLLNLKGPNYFDSIRNWDKDKNKLLSLYGYSLNDDIKGKFDFTYKDGKPFLRVLDTSIKRVHQVVNNLPKTNFDFVPKIEKSLINDNTNLTNTSQSFEKKLGTVFNFNHSQFPYFTVDLIEVIINTDNNNLSTIAKLDLNKFLDFTKFTTQESNIIQLCRKIDQLEIAKFLERNAPFSKMIEGETKKINEVLNEDTKNLIIEYIYPKLKQLFNLLENDILIYFLTNKKELNIKNLIEVNVSKNYIEPSFKVVEKENGYTLQCFVNLQHQLFELDENECNNPFIFLHNHEFMLWNEAVNIKYANEFGDGSLISITKKNWVNFLNEKIIPISRLHKIEFSPSIIKSIKEGEPETKIELKESGDYLVFQPIFNYKGYSINELENDEIAIAENDKVIIVKRNKIAENEFIRKIENLHSNFIHLPENNNLALKGIDVLKNNWYFLFIDTMKELNVQVDGFEVLKNFRFNTAKPKTKIFINSESDWFDAKVEINFGEQQITVADVKKALSNKQQFVPLADGTLGVLPEEWIKRYSLLFRMGDGKTDKLKISKYHFSVIDELYEEKDNTEMIFQLEEKYDSLKNNYKIKEIDAPKHLTKILRPYQTSGFHWLNYLTEIGWGGILADDMGLGKTIQALSFLSHYRKANNMLLALVVCPTTLIYNWENEINKFAPELTYHIHHGADRKKDKIFIENKNVIITTYGTLRSDIKIFVELPFDYVVLDESQAIKNPTSKVTKAASLLNAKHKLCMSGTPLQNNTFDIYAQMNFLNPGMLGSMDSFKNEFSLPIDKFGDKERKDHLRKILYPFILRRTKEQVAKDLPSKTEMILWCEMEEEQRTIYEAFRNDYRENILGSIENKGIGKSQLTILQGLMKLRQICDSPAIMNGDELYPNVSVKVDELARELEENCGDHKVLIFSQFLGMLALIRKKLEDQEIPFEYFDGSTSAQDRKIAIDNFQNKDHVRVFLISLKAGGVGLNLTAADYVYIVDPWWNPAVEQQAIDRTHRIGQTKNIFAYRMICKDTVEDKIIKLQERKKQLAKDIVADDDTFVKSLSKEDVEYLFS